jgi:hypothetical protein
MPFKVQVGPHQVAIHHGQTVLVSEPNGQINWPSEKGLYFLDTRVISSWAIYANGKPWDLLNGGAMTYYAARIYLTNRRIDTADGVIPQLPELYTTGVPQAWAAGSVFALLQAILGFVPDAPCGKLHVDPLLPEWAARSDRARPSSRTASI